MTYETQKLTHRWLAQELAHVRAERDAADRACAALEREVDSLRQQLMQLDADNAELIRLSSQPREEVRHG